MFANHNLVEALEARRMLSAGDLDRTFGNGGLLISPLGMDQVVGVVPTTGGKLLVAASTGTKTNHDFELARLTASGKLDKSFGRGGKVIIKFGGDDVLRKIFPLPDGDVLLLGVSQIKLCFISRSHPINRINEPKNAITRICIAAGMARCRSSHQGRMPRRRASLNDFHESDMRTSVAIA